MDFDLDSPAPAATVAAEMSGSPIADLSYRNYDGPLKSRAARWWIVALSTVRLAMKSKAYWILFSICGLRYILQCGAIYITRQLAAQIPDPTQAQQLREKFASGFFSAMCGNMNSFCLLLIALTVGAGVIAADNKSNALMVYLSKPITKGDYLLGKWMGVFLSIYAAALLPALLLYLFCIAGYRSEGFFTEDPWLFLRIPFAAAVPAAIHASLLVGLSAWSKTPRSAGATYMALYFVSYTIAGLVLALIFTTLPDTTLALLTHSSISGVIDGLVQQIYHIPTLDIPFLSGGGRGQRQSGDGRIVSQAPALWFLLTLGTALSVAGVAAARARIRAVEVVKG